MTSNYSVGPTVPRRPADFGPVAGLRAQAEEATALEAQIERMNQLVVSPLMGPLDRARLQKIHADITRITAERRRLSEGQIGRLDHILSTTERCIEMAEKWGDSSDEYV